MTYKVILLNRCQCKKCGDIVESNFIKDSKICGCGHICVSGGKQTLDRSTEDDIIDMSVTYDIEI